MASNIGTPQLLTPGRLAAELRVPIHRVLHILATRDHIQPAARAGNIRLYHHEAISQLRHEINAQDARKASRAEVTHA